MAAKIKVKIGYSFDKNQKMVVVEGLEAGSWERGVIEVSESILVSVNSKEVHRCQA
ncbi:hypothetical protein [Chryseobacterium jejuense]|uniref:hypothetical protein n=1 Tax=Chryseobacterium jejuense TaxID=445960 RepID=UPI001AE58648|nr:hypothetical protein [Chryseobacterium jejuense]MBP2619611.1 hypothetical protein [Chryseobacterium jejuense]